MCIEHLYTGDRDGYARVPFRGRSIGIHRLVLADKLGIDPDELDSSIQARHTCDNPRCIDPEHLIPGTAKENQQDKVDRGRCATGECHGKSVLTSEVVSDIRTNYQHYSRTRGLRHFAEKYNCGTSAVFAALREQTWMSTGDIS